jgi:hypothetical protein
MELAAGRGGHRLAGPKKMAKIPDAIETAA